MKITVSKQDIKDLFDEKYEEAIEDVIVVDEDGNELVSASQIQNEPDTQDEEPEEPEEQEEGNGIDEYLEDEQDEEMDLNFTAEDLVSSSGIAKVLEKALKDQGYKSRIPKEPVEKCEEAAESFIDSLKRRDRRLMKEIVSQKDFKRFALLWQDFQNFIHKKL